MPRCRRNKSIQQTQSISHRTIGQSSDLQNDRFIRGQLFARQHAAQMCGNCNSWNRTKIKALTAALNRCWNLVRLCRAKYELHMRRWFFHCFQQCIERRLSQHVNFVDDVDFELRGGGRKFAGVAQFADLFDAVVARAVNFQHVQRAAFRDLDALRVGHVEVRRRTTGAVQRLGEDAGERGLARAAWAAEEVGVRDAPGGDGVGQRG